MQKTEGTSMKKDHNGNSRIERISRGIKDRTYEIKTLNEQLTLANEELKITNEELNEYKKQLEELVSIRTHELQKKEQSLKYKNTLEKLITEISTRFFDLAPERVSENIDIALGEICGFIKADAAFLLEMSQVDNQYSMVNSWNKKTVSWNKEYFDNAPFEDIAQWYSSKKDKDQFIIHSKDDLPDNSFIRADFSHSGNKSMIIIPILFQEKLIGFVGFSSVKSKHVWNPDEISLIRITGEIFVNALKRKAAEKILIESERNYREIFNATNEAIFIYDIRQAKIIDVNPAALRLYGITHEEAVNQSLFSYSEKISGFNYEGAKEKIQQAIQTGTAEFEWLIYTKSGETRWVEISLKSTEIAGDWRIIAVMRDISERKKSQTLIAQSEERFRSIIQYLTDIIWIIDKKITISYESPSSWQVLGYPPGYLIGRNGLDIIHPDDMTVVMKELKEVFDKVNDHLPTEFRVRHANGSWISLEVIANNMLEHPAIEGIVITGRDVTERNRVEKALRISESKFRNIFNNSTDAIAIVGANYSLLEVNEEFMNLTGFTPEESRKMKLTEIITDSYLPIVVDKMMRIFQNDYQPAVECEIASKSKEVFPAEINSKLIEYEGDHVLISVIRNITERRFMENRILDTIISTEEQEREKFARNLHDDLGPLLSSIKMYVNSLDSAIDKKKHDFVIAQLKKIITEVIQSTKELSNDLSPHVLINYGLLAALEWFINQLKLPVSISLESNLKEERYPSSVELSMYRIIKELINNTLKHAQASHIHIKLHRILKKVHLIYSDDGIGFKESWNDNIVSMGMGMSNIISRSRLINATSKFFNNAPHGMSFEMEIPVEQ
ncbi:MAG: PAS domain S-box protein [Bacteroidales bacterium]|nr:PAS domain S-box protein [Bacteroidales bacterium]